MVHARKQTPVITLEGMDRTLLIIKLKRLVTLFCSDINGFYRRGFVFRFCILTGQVTLWHIAYDPMSLRCFGRSFVNELKAIIQDAPGIVGVGAAFI